MTSQPPGRPDPPPEGTSFLIARAKADREERARPSGGRLRFKIQHLMWLSVWVALVLAVREPLVASLPEAVTAIVAISAGLAVAMIAGLYGIALLMPEGLRKDELVVALLYGLAGDLVLFLVVLLLDARK